MSNATTNTTENGGGNNGFDLEAFFAKRQAVNEQQMRYFAAGICGLTAILVVFHWTRWLCVRSEMLPALRGLFALITRPTRNILLRKVPGFGSAGHALLVVTYVAINAAVAFTNMDASSLSNFASRFGWMTTGNMCMLVFLALKNTPMVFLSAYSYERLNCVHQAAGYTMFVWMVLHAATYTSFFHEEGRLASQFSETKDIFAIVSGFAFLVAVFAAVVLRRIWYELFYVLHILGWVLGVVAVGFHQPSLGKPILAMTVLSASIWVVDRFIRGVRMLYYAKNNFATLHPLPDGGTKILMRRVPFRAEPGQHCFVWIPSIRSFETHPFTIVSTKPLEFTVRARDGFTGDLHKYAVSHPGAAVRASVDGPYGTFPDPTSFNKVLLIAGGGGATFTFGLAVNVLERMQERAENSLVFVWAVKKHENLAWNKDHLRTLRTHTHSSKVNISLFVTRTPSSPHYEHHLRTVGSMSSESSGSPLPLDSPSATDVEKALPRQQPRENTPEPSPSGGECEKEMDKFQERHGEYRPSVDMNAVPGQASDHVGHPVPELRHRTHTCRPDVESLIRDAVNSTPRGQRILVAACGPAGLMRVVRDTTASLIRLDGPGVELHCEQFGW